MLVLLGVYLMAQYTARTNVAMCQAANLCASQPAYYHAMAKAEGNLAEGLLGAIPRVGPRGIRVSETPVLRGFSLAAGQPRPHQGKDNITTSTFNATTRLCATSASRPARSPPPRPA